MFNSLDINGSALSAHKLYLDTISNNLANINTIQKPGTEGYKRQSVVFEAFEDALNSKLGVKVSKVNKEDRESIAKYDPENEYADENGYVYYPDIDVSEEMADMIVAQRGYQLNLTCLDYIRETYEKALTIGQ